MQGNRRDTYNLFKFQSLIHLSREPVNQKSFLSGFLDGGLHGIFKKRDGDLHRNDLAFLNIYLNQITILRTGAVLLLSKKVSSYKARATTIRARDAHISRYSMRD